MKWTCWRTGRTRRPSLLARWGVRTLLIEKHRELSPFPRSRLVDVRSMEIFRQLGIAATVQGRAFGPRFGRVRFRDRLFDRDFGSPAMIGVHDPIPDSPTGRAGENDHRGVRRRSHAVGELAGVPVRVELLADQGHGVLLVRPDGYIA